LGTDFPPKILNITVPQVGHLPLMALRPFFIVSSMPLAISFLALHLTQYPSAIKIFTVQASCPNGEGRVADENLKRNSEKDVSQPPKIKLLTQNETSSTPGLWQNAVFLCFWLKTGEKRLKIEGKQAPAQRYDWIACFRNSVFKIFPVAFLGRAGSTTICFGAL
jgi:hypothetical protein